MVGMLTIVISTNKNAIEGSKRRYHMVDKNVCMMDTIRSRVVKDEEEYICMFYPAIRVCLSVVVDCLWS